MVLVELFSKKQKREEQWAQEKREALEVKRKEAHKKKELIGQKVYQYFKEYAAHVVIAEELDASPPFCGPLENALEDQGHCLYAAFNNKCLLCKIKMTQNEMLKFPDKCGHSLPKNTNCCATVSDEFSFFWF